MEKHDEIEKKIRKNEEQKESNTDQLEINEQNEETDNEIEEKYLFISPANRGIAGLFMMGLSGLYYIVANTLIQIVYTRSSEHVTSFSLVLARSVVATVFAAVFLVIGRVNPFQSLNMMLAQTILGISSFGSILFLYLSLERIPVGDATAIQCMVPIFTTILSIIFLKQKSNFMDYICCFFGIIGLVIMTRPMSIFGLQDNDSRELCKKVSGCNKDVTSQGNSTDYTYGVIYSLLSAFTIAIFFILVKALGRRGDFMIGIFYLGIVGSVIPIVHDVVRSQKPQLGIDERDWIIIFLASFLSYLSLMFLAEALQLEDAGPASMIRYTDFVYAFILQYLILGIKPTILTIIGAFIIICSTGTLTLYRHFAAKKAAKQAKANKTE